MIQIHNWSLVAWAILGGLGLGWVVFYHPPAKVIPIRLICDGPGLTPRYCFTYVDEKDMLKNDQTR